MTNPTNESLESKYSIEYLKRFDFFQNLSEQSIKNISKSSQVLSFNEGWPLSNNDFIQKNIFFILQGQARLIGLENNKIKTIAKLANGSIIGLGSILRGEACEQVNASTRVQVLSISDELILQLYKNDIKFKSWCDQTIFPCEIASITEKLILKSSRTDINFTKAFNVLFQSKQIKILNEVSSISKGDNAQLNWYLGSTNSEEIEIGNHVKDDSIIRSKNIFKSRILGIPENYIRLFDQPIKKSNLNKESIPENINAQIHSNLLPEQSHIFNDKYEKEINQKLISGKGPVEESLACMKMLTNALDMPLRKDTVEKILKDEFQKNGNISPQLLSSILSMLGLYTSNLKIPSNLGTRLPSPSLITWKDSFALVSSTDSKGLHIASPTDGYKTIQNSELEETFPDDINLLLIEKSSLTPNKKFGFNWFLPSLKKYKTGLLLVLLSSFIVQLFGLANPLLIQVIIDKVISQRSLDTLQVLGFALVFVTFLGGILGGLRTFLFTETTNRIDTRLASEVIDHLLRLPLRYFDNRPVGELGSRVGELEKIRDFLTGQALTTVLDAIFSIIYIVVMVLYSWLLTFVALAVVPIQIGITLLGSPIIRGQIRNVANQNAKTQSHLIEVLTGIQTVKAQNIETVTRWKWQDLYANYISKSFARTITGTGLSQTSQVLQQLSQLLVLWIGASLVLEGSLSLGQLIAFRIISSYVTQPLLRLSTIWQSFQELKVSFERLADIIDTPEESSEKDKNNIGLPNIEGEIEFKGVSFSFNKGSKQILNNINLSVSKSEFVGIAGQSGSGKSTLMKLLPRLYEVDNGKIIIDKYDISKVELYSLRKQIGVVPQEPLLFSGSISENIAITNPDINESEIVRAAKIANAHDFIMELPEGYSSDVGERGSRLSGGQKQRIAIARTLVSKPRLLIMDEATSALDYDSERKVCENLKENSNEMTVFFITHRLSTIKNADKIVMMADGSVSEIGSHKELMNIKGSYYALYRQQEAE